MKETTDFNLGYFGPEALGKVRGTRKVIDWEKCQSIVEELIKDPRVIRIDLGLVDDWLNTCDNLWHFDTGFNEYCDAYLASVWARPIINVERFDEDYNEEEIECWLEDPEGIHSRYMPRWFKDHFNIKEEEES